MRETERIADQLRRAYEGDAWHGPALREILSGVTAAVAAGRPIPNGHTIWEIVPHIGAWEAIVLRRMGGETLIRIPTEQDWPAVRDTSEAGWKSTLAALEAGHQRLRGAIAQMPDERLQEKVPGKGHTFYVELHGIVQHDLYHAGQIALLKKAVKRPEA
jgi:uncharacterized damage-inducible protein DinB